MRSVRLGFTLVEVVVVMAIIVIVTSIVAAAFLGIGRNKATDADAYLVKTVLQQARAATLASKDDARYGVHLSDSAAVLFKGATYSPSDPDNVTSALSSRSHISGWTLSGGGQDIVFKRLTGETDQFGTVTVSDRADASIAFTIVVEATGLAEVQ